MPGRGSPCDSPARPPSAVLVLAMVTLLGLIGACSVGPSTRPAIIVNDGTPPRQAPSAAPDVAPVPPLTAPGPGTVSWQRCDDAVRERLADVPQPEWLRWDCARVNTVLDSPDLPGRGVSRLTVLRAGSGAIPVLVVSDISGEPGTVRAARLAAALPRELLTTFSLVGLDRRGTGGSDPVRCVPEEVRTAIVHADPADADIRALLGDAGKAGQQCVINLERRLGALDTWRTSADLDRVRDALGIDRLNAIGLGEGSRVLAVFADRFPHRVGRMVLDGLPDPTENSVAALADVAAGAEAAFAAFADDCRARGCALGQDPARAMTELVDRLRAAPPAETDEDRLSAGAAVRAVLIGLADRPQWPALADAIDRARSGDTGALLELVGPLLHDSAETPNTLDVSLVTGCNDTRDRLSVEPMANAAKEWQRRYPLFGGLMAQRLVLCAAWPIAAHPPQPAVAKGAPPILVLSTAGDPVTPEQGTRRAAQLLTGAVDVSWSGAGHGALANSRCATDAAVSFLAAGTVPTDGTTCPP